MRDCKIVNDSLSIVSINREFSKGKKYHFSFGLADPTVMEIFKREKYDEKGVIYEDVLW